MLKEFHLILLGCKSNEKHIKIKHIFILVFFLCSFQDVYFPSVIVCNINQIRRSLFRGLGIKVISTSIIILPFPYRFYRMKFDCIFFHFQNYSDIDLLYHQFYTGLDRNLTSDEQKIIMSLATSEVSIIPIHRYKENFSLQWISACSLILKGCTQFIHTVKYMQHFCEDFLCILFVYTHECPRFVNKKKIFKIPNFYFHILYILHIGIQLGGMYFVPILCAQIYCRRC